MRKRRCRGALEAAPFGSTATAGSRIPAGDGEELNLEPCRSTQGPVLPSFLSAILLYRFRSAVAWLKDSD